MLKRGKKVLIVSASIGAGHNQAAQALQAAWQQDFPQDTVQIVDFMDGERSYFNHLLKETYLKMITISPDIYETLYRWTQETRQGSFKVRDILCWTMRKTMEEISHLHRPDAVICTHPFPCGAAAYLKKKNRLHVPLIGVITDYVVHRLWLYPEVGLFTVATKAMQKDLLEQGVAADRIRVTGIPIHPRFDQSVTSGIFTGLPGLDINRTTVLIMGGGLGLGPVQDLIRELNEIAVPLQVIAVAGSNAALRDNLTSVAQQSRHRVEVLGFTQHIREWMSISDFLITKPGALTISEALAMELPMLFYESIPGQEMDNAAYIVNKGAACWIRNGHDAAGAGAANVISRLLNRPDELAKMRQATRRIRQPGAAMAAVRTIVHHINGNQVQVQGM